MQDAGYDYRHREKLKTNLLAHVKWASAVRRAWNMVESGSIIGLLGDRGNGKTQAAALLGLWAANRLKPTRYLRCRQIGMAVRATYRDNATATEEQALRRFVDPWLLVLDEAQEKFDTDHELKTLTLLLDMRYGACRPTVLIANCDEQAFCSLMGPAVIDRMREGGGALVFDWESFRK